MSDRLYPDAAGQERLLEVATYPLFDPQGEISSIIRLERDVTEKREMEEALAFRSKELQKTQHQLETLFELARQVSPMRPPGHPAPPTVAVVETMAVPRSAGIVARCQAKGTRSVTPRSSDGTT